MATLVLDKLVEGMQSVVREGESGAVELAGRAMGSGPHARDVDAWGAAGPPSVPGGKGLLPCRSTDDSRLSQEFLSWDRVCGEELHNADVFIKPRREGKLPLPVRAFPSTQDRAYVES